MEEYCIRTSSSYTLWSPYVYVHNNVHFILDDGNLSPLELDIPQVVGALQHSN